MNPQASTAAGGQPVVGGVGTNRGGETGHSTAGVNDMLQSLYRQMREGRYSSEAAAFGGWGGYSGQGLQQHGVHRAHPHTAPHGFSSRSGHGMDGAMAPYYDPMSQAAAHQEALYHQAQISGERGNSGNGGSGGGGTGTGGGGGGGSAVIGSRGAPNGFSGPGPGDSQEQGGGGQW